MKGKSKKSTYSTTFGVDPVVFDSWLEQGKVSDLSEISRITGLSRFMVSKIFNFRLYPTSVQLEFLEIT